MKRLIAMLVAGLFLAGCGDNSTPAITSAAPPPSTTVAEPPCVQPGDLQDASWLRKMLTPDTGGLDVMLNKLPRRLCSPLSVQTVWYRMSFDGQTWPPKLVQYYQRSVQFDGSQARGMAAIPSTTCADTLVVVYLGSETVLESDIPQLQRTDAGGTQVVAFIGRVITARYISAVPYQPICS